MTQALLTVIILTRDEAVHLPACLASVAGVAAEVVVVDSGSTDATRELARARGAVVYQRPWQGPADQLNWALATHPFKTPWCLRLDADERLDDDLRQCITAELAAAAAGVGGFAVRRKVYFWGRWIRFGGYYPVWLLRIWRRDQARCEARAMDEHMLLTAGTVGQLGGHIIDDNRKGLTQWTEKHNRYSDAEVRVRLGARGGDGALAGQARRKRWAKERVYLRLPPLARAVAYWLLRYVVLLGFLDGVPGFVFHFLQALWYQVLVDAKLLEHRRLAAEERDGGAADGGVVDDRSA